MSSATCSRIEDTVQIDVEDGLSLGQRQLGGGMEQPLGTRGPADSGTGDEEIDAPEAISGPLGHLVHGVGTGDIERQSQVLATQGQELRQGIPDRRLPAPDDRYIVPHTRESTRRRTPDATGSAGDDNDLGNRLHASTAAEDWGREGVGRRCHLAPPVAMIRLTLVYPRSFNIPKELHLPHQGILPLLRRLTQFALWTACVWPPEATAGKASGRKSRRPAGTGPKKALSSARSPTTVN